MIVRRSRSGAMAPLAYFAVATIAIVVALGIAARRSDLAFESRGLERAQARWAAESALARAMAELSAGRLPSNMSGPLKGSTCAEVRYALKVERSPRGVSLIGEGLCQENGRSRPARSRITALARGSGNQWRFAEWNETSP